MRGDAEQIERGMIRALNQPLVRIRNFPFDETGGTAAIFSDVSIAQAQDLTLGEKTIEQI